MSFYFIVFICFTSWFILLYYWPTHSINPFMIYTYLLYHSGLMKKSPSLSAGKKKRLKNKQIDVLFYPTQSKVWCYPSFLLKKASNKKMSSEKPTIFNTSMEKRVKTQTIGSNEKQHQTSLPKIRPQSTMSGYNKFKVLKTLQNLQIPKNKSTIFSNFQVDNLPTMKQQTLLSFQISQSQFYNQKQNKSSKNKKEYGRHTQMNMRDNIDQMAQTIRPITMKIRSKTQMNQPQTPIHLEKKQKRKPKLFQVLADLRKETQIQKKYAKTQKIIAVSKPTHQPPQIQLHTFRPPNLPDTPKKNSQLSQYIQQAKKVAHIFNLQFNQFQVVIRRYKNCITFEANQKTIIWNYDGKIYVGDWKDIDKERGQGIKQGKGFQKSNQYSYKGDFHDGKKHGKGIILHQNGNIYDGQWVNGKMEGKGVFFDKKRASYYQGSWKQNHLQGQCRVKKSKKDYFYGQFAKSKKNGRGVEYHQNGDIYEGQYKQGKKEGRGRYYSANGDIYIGEFKNDVKHGVGLFYNCKYPGSLVKNYYFGEIFQGKKCGYGIQTHEDGSIYRGYFHNNQRNGPGFLSNSNNITIRGKWKRGELEQLNRSINLSVQMN